MKHAESDLHGAPILSAENLHVFQLGKRVRESLWLQNDRDRAHKDAATSSAYLKEVEDQIADLDNHITQLKEKEALSKLAIYNAEQKAPILERTIQLIRED